jgi:cytoskeletal protein RodZ
MNNKGFTVIEGLLIFVIAGIIGAIGWYVISSNRNINDLLSDADKSNSNIAVTNKKQTTKSKSSQSTSDSSKASVSQFSYTAPNGWGVSKNTSIPDNYEVDISSPDFKDTSKDLNCSYTGMQFKITNTNKFVDENKVSKMLAPDYKSPLIKNIRESSLGGIKAVEYISTPGECGYRLNTETVYKGYSYSISTPLGEESSISTYRDRYNQLVSSFKY